VVVTMGVEPFRQAPLARNGKLEEHSPGIRDAVGERVRARA
jgi:hypothetical protein